MTNEQIESLGWMGRNNWYVFKDNTRWFLQKEAGDDIWIQQVVTDYGIDRYRGACSTIEELKGIMERLKIVPDGK